MGYCCPLPRFICEGIVASIEPDGEVPIIEQRADESSPGAADVEHANRLGPSEQLVKFAVEAGRNRVVVLAAPREFGVVRRGGKRVVSLDYGHGKPPFPDRFHVILAAQISKKAFELIEPPSIQVQCLEFAKTPFDLQTELLDERPLFGSEFTDLQSQMADVLSKLLRAIFKLNQAGLALRERP